MSDETQNKIRVRIAVSIDAHGYWHAAGGSASTENRDCYSSAIDDARGGNISMEDVTMHWVEVEIPIPRVSILQGTLKGKTKHDNV